MLSSLLVYPEARAALAAARRREQVGKGLLERAVRGLDGVCDEIEMIGCDEPLARMAGELSERYGLRGYDAVHLASALSAGDERLLLATWDRELAEATVAAGLAVSPAQ